MIFEKPMFTHAEYLEHKRKKAEIAEAVSGLSHAELMTIVSLHALDKRLPFPLLKKKEDACKSR